MRGTPLAPIVVVCAGAWFVVSSLFPARQVFAAEPAPKILRTVFESSFDTGSLGQAPGIVVNTTFDTERVGGVLDEVLGPKAATPARLPQPAVVVSSSFDDGISPQLFQWSDDGPFSTVAEPRTGKLAVSVSTANAMLSTHKLPCQPGRWYEVSVWHRGEGRARLSISDGVGTYEWLSAPVAAGRTDPAPVRFSASDAEWRLAQHTFLALPPPPLPPGGKVVQQPVSALTASFGLSGSGKMVFDDFQIVQFGDDSIPAQQPVAWDWTQARDSVWLLSLCDDSDEKGTGPIRVRNGRTLLTKFIPIAPGAEYVVRFYYRGLGSQPALPHRVSKSICAGRVYLDVKVGDAPPRYWGFPANLMLDAPGVADKGSKLVTLRIPVPPKLWDMEPKAFAVRFSSHVPASCGFDYDQFGDFVIQEFSVVRAWSGEVTREAGDEFWDLPDPRRATTKGNAGWVEVVEKAGIGQTRAVRIGAQSELTSYLLKLAPPEFLDIGWYYKGIRSEANRANLSAGTRGCGRLWTSLRYEDRAFRDSGYCMPMQLAEPEKPDAEWRYARFLQYIPAAPKGQAPDNLLVRVSPEVTLDFPMRGEFLLDNFAVRRLTAMQPGCPGDSLWLGIPDPKVATTACGPDCTLKILPKAGVGHSRAIQLDGRYPINTIRIPVEAKKSYTLALRYKVLRSADWPGVGQVGAYVEIVWMDEAGLNETFNTTHLKPAESGQPDKDWQVQRIRFTVPEKLRNDVVPTAVRIQLVGYGTALLDDVRLDEVE